MGQIKKGDSFLCIENYYMLDERLAFEKGKTYESILDGTLRSEVDSMHFMFIDTEFEYHFKKL